MAESSSTKRSRIVVLISGGGSNLQALIDACNTTRLPTSNIVGVISNRKDAFGLTRAATWGIPARYHNLVTYKKQQPANPDGVQLARRAYDQDLAKLISEYEPDVVVCAGWMHILSSDFVAALENARVPVINLHPALPGQFSGAGAIHRAYEAFQNSEIDHTGVMVHRVISEVDMGQPIITRRIPMVKGESEEELERRIHAVEWEVIVDGTAKTIDERNTRNTAAN